MAMETTLNWAKLYNSGRCKDYGIPWTPEEHQAVLKLGIPPEYVRVGVLTKEALAERLAEESRSKTTPLIKLSKEELLGKAQEKGIPATNAASKESLIRAIEQKVEPKEKKSKNKPKK